MEEDASDDNIQGEVFESGGKILTAIILLPSLFIFSLFLLVSNNPDILNLVTIESLVSKMTTDKIIIFFVFIFAMVAFWGSHNKKKIPEILEFKEPTFPKE